MTLDSLRALLETWGCPALAALLTLAGIGLPIPEDLLLLTAGYLVAIDVFHWSCVLPLALTCIVGTDLLAYALGRRMGGRTAVTSHIPFVSVERCALMRQRLTRFGPSIVLAARFMPGTRVLVFISAGANGMPIGRFLQFDLLGAVLWVPAMLIAGHTFAEHLGGLHDALRWFQRGALWALGVISLIVILWLRERPGVPHP